ncbi:MAG: sugar phosphate isomerase/epimerase, partial [Verrucomicrobia bacterium]|nr:sugar phosphate isomerase/epimerase [Verrucomicrobiota bacterium]
MGKSIFHSSIEGGQHGPKGLEGFLAFAKQAGAAGAQPTCYMLENGKGGFKTAAEIKDTFAKYGLKFDGISCHCVTWV